MSETTHIILVLLATHLAVVMTPGINTAAVVQAAARDRRAGALVALGFWPAGFLYTLAGLAGLGSLLNAMPWFTVGLRVAGGGYLLWMGLRMLAASFGPQTAAADMPVLSPRAALWQGFLTNLTNPKSLAYYASVFAATNAFALPLHVQLVLAFVMPFIGTMWYMTIVALASSGLARKGFDRTGRWLDRGAGTLMLFFGFKLLATR